MTIEVTDEDTYVRVEFIDTDGGSASAVVVGETASSVKERADQIVDIHNLKSKAQS